MEAQEHHVRHRVDHECEREDERRQRQADACELDSAVPCEKAGGRPAAARAADLPRRLHCWVHALYSIAFRPLNFSFCSQSAAASGDRSPLRALAIASLTPAESSPTHVVWLY